MVRSEWLNLNGLWDYAINSGLMPPKRWEGKILVPFPVESALSGVMKQISPNDWLWYRRTFTVPREWAGRRILLHFEAVDWESTVWLNGMKLATHQGGYDSFTYDITDALTSSGAQELVVAVSNPADSGMQPRGKQTQHPHRTWHNMASGIWQTVWLEPVAPVSIERLWLTPDIDKGALNITAQIRGNAPGLSVEAFAYDQDKFISHAKGVPGRKMEMPIPDEKLWTPNSPFLYNLKLVLLENGKRVDQIGSYFGMRKISVEKDDMGIPQLYLNNKAVFQLGVLNHGYWPDGIYTAPTDDALRYDIEMAKRLGFNACRMHMKVESERWYCWCDRVGLLVWQDMPNGAVGVSRSDVSRSKSAAEEFEHELRAMIEQRYNHPSIVIWVLFNENWGQYDTPRLTDLTKNLDLSRLVISATGGKDHHTGDIYSEHNYSSFPVILGSDQKRAIVFGEYGGIALYIENHDWPGIEKWLPGCGDTNQVTTNFLMVMRFIQPHANAKLSGAIYTELSDVESEVNGLMTYDREILKVDGNVVGKAVLGTINCGSNVAALKLEDLAKLNGDAGTSGVWQDKTEDYMMAEEGDDPAYTIGNGGHLRLSQFVPATLILLITGGFVVLMNRRRI